MKIAYAVPYPVSGAVGQRVLGVTRALLSIEHVHEVTVVGPSYDMTDELRGLSFCIAEKLKPAPRTARDKLLRRLRLGHDTVAQLDAMHKSPDLLIAYGGGAMYMRRLQKWSRARGVKIAADIVEWYDSSHLPMGRFGPLAIDNHLMMTRVAPNCDGIVAISTFLSRHFRQKAKGPVVVVPPVMDIGAVAVRSGATTARRVELAYCGVPGKKDRLDLILRAAIELDPRGTRLRLTVAGPNRRNVAQLARVDELPPVINAVGHVSRQESLELVSAADWVPLIRDDKRFAHAGFPTKVAEAMSVGTPVIANITSDIGKVLTDTVSGIVAEAPTLAATRKAIARAMDLNSEQYGEMRREAHARAREVFAYQHYVTPLHRWLDLIMASHNE